MPAGRCALPIDAGLDGDDAFGRGCPYQKLRPCVMNCVIDICGTAVANGTTPARGLRPRRPRCKLPDWGPNRVFLEGAGASAASAEVRGRSGQLIGGIEQDRDASGRPRAAAGRRQRIPVRAVRPLGAHGFQPQRCRAMTVSGLTMRTASFPPDQSRDSRTQRMRSQSLSMSRGRDRVGA